MYYLEKCASCERYGRVAEESGDKVCALCKHRKHKEDPKDKKPEKPEDKFA